LATILGSTLAPEQATSTLGLITRAVVYIIAVFGLAAIASQLIFLFHRQEHNTRSEDIAIHTATATLWLPPLLMFSGQRSWFALVIFLVLALAMARLVAFLKAVPAHAANVSPEYQAFPLLKRDFPFGSSILAAFMLQGAIFAGLDGRVALAGLLYLAGTAAVVCRSFQMFCDLPAIGERDSTRSVSAILIATTLLIVFAWLPYVVQSVPDRGSNSSVGTGSGHAQWQQHETSIDKSKNNEGNASTLAWLKALFSSEPPGSRGGSFAVAKHMFDSTFPADTKSSGIGPTTGLNTNIAVMMIVGPVFPGVELYPEAPPHTMLVAPLAAKNEKGVSHTDPLSIPFDGVYWFWRGPSDLPPSNSVVMHGSPSAQYFRSTDGDGMSMEAKQNLGFAVDPRSYGAIEVDIENADPFPNSVGILLKVRNTALASKPIQSLGMENVVTPASSEAHAVTQTLRFRLPSRLGSFDELTVSYYLRGARSNRSARIAIERFRLVPRG
jgi:hypothetical protein